MADDSDSGSALPLTAREIELIIMRAEEWHQDDKTYEKADKMADWLLQTQKLSLIDQARCLMLTCCNSYYVRNSFLRAEEAVRLLDEDIRAWTEERNARFPQEMLNEANRLLALTKKEHNDWLKDKPKSVESVFGAGSKTVDQREDAMAVEKKDKKSEADTTILHTTPESAVQVVSVTKHSIIDRPILDEETATASGSDEKEEKDKTRPEQGKQAWLKLTPEEGRPFVPSQGQKAWLKFA